MKFLIVVFTFIFFTGMIAQAKVVQSGTYKVVSDVCFDQTGNSEQMCDPDWKVTIQELEITMSVGSNPLEGFIHVVPTEQIIPKHISNGVAYPVYDATVPSGFFSNDSIVQTDSTVYVYSNTAWVSKKYVGENTKGRYDYAFSNDKLTFTVFGVSKSGLTDRIIREMTFQK